MTAEMPGAAAFSPPATAPSTPPSFAPFMAPFARLLPNPVMLHIAEHSRGFQHQPEQHESDEYARGRHLRLVDEQLTERAERSAHRKNFQISQKYFHLLTSLSSLSGAHASCRATFRRLSPRECRHGHYRALRQLRLHRFATEGLSRGTCAKRLNYSHYRRLV